MLYFEFPYDERHVRLLEHMLTIDHDLYKLGFPLDEGKIVFYDADGHVLKTWKFKDAAIVHYKVVFGPNGTGLMLEMAVSAAIQDYGHKVVRHRHVTPN